MKNSIKKVSRLTRQKHIFIQSFVDSAVLTTLKHRKFIAKQIADLFSHPFAKKIFSASADSNWTAEAFHKICDGKGPSLTLIRTTEGKIFGGFTEVSFDSPKPLEPGFYKEDPNAFLFVCEPHWQVYPVVEPKKAIFCDANIMVQFGYSDIVILNAPSTHCDNYSYPSTAYPSIGLPKKSFSGDNLNSMSSDNLGSGGNSDASSSSVMDVRNLVTSFTVNGDPKFTVEELEVY